MGEAATDGLAWTLDSVHFPDPVTRWSSTLYTTYETRIVARVLTDIGLLLGGVAFREFDGRIYSAVVPLGGRSRTALPRWLIPVMCRTVPRLRRRLAAGHAADVTDWPGRVVEEWEGGAEEELLERGKAYLAGDLAALTTGQVAARLEEQLRFTEECLSWHTRLHVAGADAIGRLGLEVTRSHGWTAGELVDLFTGLSPSTTEPAEAQRAIVDLVREAGALPVLDAAGTLADVAAISPAVSAALQGYQELWGQRAVRYEVACPTVVEHPEWLLRQLQDAAHLPADRKEVAQRHEATRATAEARLLAALGNSSLTRRRLARARRVFPHREGNEAATIGIPVAGLRRLGLHIGGRLGLYRPEDAFDLTFEEIVEALRRPDDVGDRAPLALQRREERERMAAKAPAAEIGEPPANPPDRRGFPRAAVEQLDALLWYTDQVMAPLGSARLDDGVISGLGASPGVYEGRARLIRDEGDFERIRPNDVVVCPITSPVWSIVLPGVGALVCDGGGVLSHSAIIAREFGVPAVVATASATTIIPEGGRVRVDGRSGEVTLLR